MPILDGVDGTPLIKAGDDLKHVEVTCVFGAFLHSIRQRGFFQRVPGEAVATRQDVGSVQNFIVI